MKKRFLVFGIVAVLLLIGVTGVFLLSKRSTSNTNNNSQQVLSDTTTNENLPILEIASGNIEVKKPNDSDFSEGVNDEKIPVGTIIKTDGEGRGQLIYPNHSATRIDFNSQMTLKEFSENPNTTDVTLDLGRIWSRVAKLLGKGDSSSTQTDTLVASVRGTSYGLGILPDGSNKVIVGKSTVHVDCTIDNFQTDVEINKKLTTKCATTLQTLNWDNSDYNDEWFIWNQNEDKKLDDEFGKDTYGDQATPTPSPKPTIKPTPKPTNTPTAKPTATPVPSPSSSPTPLTISDIIVVCGAYSNNPCSSRTVTQLKVIGTAYSEGAHPTITATNTNPDSSQSYTGANKSFSGDSSGSSVVVEFPAALYGTYTVKIDQYGQSAQKDITIGYQE